MQANDYRRIEQAIGFICRNYSRQPSLAEIAANVHLSPHHFNRMFKRWTGITPKQFVQHLTLDFAKRRLDGNTSVLEAAHDAGLSGSGRLHDLFVTIDAVTPGEYKSGGQGTCIEYGVHQSPFGQCVIGVTERGICHLGFPADPNESLADLNHHWPNSIINHNASRTAHVLECIFEPEAANEIRVVLRGTNFQLKVWQALLNIPSGRTVTYGDIADAIGRPTSSRAVGNAVGSNPVAFIIPCHRVLRGSGALGGYRWGTDRKQAILAWEIATAAAAAAAGHQAPGTLDQLSSPAAARV